MADLVLNANSSPVIADWTGSGTTPYIDATDASYVANSTKNVNSAEFSFEESADLGTMTSVIFSVRALSTDGKGDLKVDESSYKISHQYERELFEGMRVCIKELKDENSEEHRAIMIEIRKKNGP